MEHLESAILDCTDQIIKKTVNEYFQEREESGETVEPINLIQTALDDVVDGLNWNIVQEEDINALESGAIWLLAYARAAKKYGVMIHGPILGTELLNQ